MMGPLKPPALKVGDTIGVIAPSSHIADDKIAAGISYLEGKGFRVRLHDQVHARHGQFAGTDAARVHALHDMFRDPTIKAIFTTCGGNGATHLLSSLDYDLIQSHPKIILGFSDITAILNAITAKTDIATFHGPTLSRFDVLDSEYPDQLITLLTTGRSAPIQCGDVLKSGSVEGRLIGGNLSVLQALIGTPYAPDVDAAILFIEDVGDHLSRYDRMLGQMKNAGWFNRLAGLVIGEFLNTQDNETRPFGFTLEERLLDLLKGYDFPITTGAPIGHGKKLVTLPIGVRTKLENATLTLLDSPVA
jgi:muramoyltetrapeptide carboxypeptidase